MPGASNLLQAPGFLNLTCLFFVILRWSSSFSRSCTCVHSLLHSSTASSDKKNPALNPFVVFFCHPSLVFLVRSVMYLMYTPSFTRQPPRLTKKIGRIADLQTTSIVCPFGAILSLVFQIRSGRSCTLMPQAAPKSCAQPPRLTMKKSCVKSLRCLFFILYQSVFQAELCRRPGLVAGPPGH